MAYIIPEYEFNTLEEAVKYCFEKKISKLVWNGLIYFILVDGNYFSTNTKYNTQ